MNYTYLMEPIPNKEELEKSLQKVDNGPAYVEVTDPLEKEFSEGKTMKLRHLTEYPTDIDTIII